MRCSCGQIADPDWGQCYDCWLTDRLASEQPDPRQDEYERAYYAEMQAQYEAEVWWQYQMEMGQDGCWD